MKLLDEEAQLLLCDLKSYETFKVDVDAAILELCQKQAARKDFVLVSDFKKKFEGPLFVVMEKPTSTDQITVLALGVLSVIEKPINKNELEKQIRDILSWAWYFKWKNKKK